MNKKQKETKIPIFTQYKSLYILRVLNENTFTLEKDIEKVMESQGFLKI